MAVQFFCLKALIKYNCTAHAVEKANFHRSTEISQTFFLSMNR